MWVYFGTRFFSQKSSSGSRLTADLMESNPEDGDVILFFIESLLK